MSEGENQKESESVERRSRARVHLGLLLEGGGIPLQHVEEGLGALQDLHGEEEDRGEGNKRSVQLTEQVVQK